MSADPKAPNPLSDEARELLSAAVKPRPMTLVERKVAAHAVAKIAAAPVGFVAGGITATKLAAVAVVGASVAIVAAQQQPSRPSEPRATIARATPTATPRATSRGPVVTNVVAPAPPVVAPVAPNSPIVLAAPAPRAIASNVRFAVNRASARPVTAASPLTSSSRGLPLPNETFAQPPEQRENNALQQALAAIARDPAAALSMLDAYDREFPRGRLRDEREFLGVLALDRSGDYEQARSRARALLARDPASMYAVRLRRIANRSQ
jgi:hypothetical protein